MVPFAQLDWYIRLRTMVLAGECPLLHGHFSGSKTSAVHFLIAELQAQSTLRGHYISFLASSLRRAMKLGVHQLVVALISELRLPALPANSGLGLDVLALSLSSLHPHGNVLFFDEIDYMRQEALPTVWREFKEFIKIVRDGSKMARNAPRVLHSMICIGSCMLTADVAGDPSIPISMDEGDSVGQSAASASSSSSPPAPTSPTPAALASASSPLVSSPWNAQNAVEAQHFTLEQHTQFFACLTAERGLQIPPQVVTDIWARTQGHPGLLGHCADKLFQLGGSALVVQASSWATYRELQLHQDTNGMAIVSKMKEVGADQSEHLRLL